MNEEVTPTCWSWPSRVPEAEEQRADQRPGPVLVPAEAGHHAVGGADVLDLRHRSLAGLVGRIGALRDHPVQPRALEDIEPSAGDRRVGRGRREMHRFGRIAGQLLEPSAAFGEGAVAKVVVALGQAVEGDEGCRRGRGEHPDPRLGWMDPDEQRVEVEPALGPGDDDLTVDDEAGIGATQGEQRRVELGEVSVQRLAIARLEEDRCPVAEGDGAEPVPLRLIGPAVSGRDLRCRLGQHRLERWVEWQGHAADDTHTRSGSCDTRPP